MRSRLVAGLLLFAVPAVAQYSGSPSGQHAVDIKAGRIGNVSSVHKFGFNSDVDTGAEEDVWDKGGIYPWQTANQGIELVSSSDEDSTGNAGALSVVVQGQNLAGTEWADTLTTDGTNAVALSDSAVVVYRMWVETAGDSTTNVGSIVCRVAAAGDTLAMIGAGNGQTLMSIYRVPAGKTAYVTSVALREVGSVQADCIIKLWKRPSGGAWRVQDVFGLRGDGTSSDQIYLENPVVCPALTEIRVSAVTDANNTQIGASFDLTLEVD